MFNRAKYIREEVSLPMPAHLTSFSQGSLVLLPRTQYAEICNAPTYPHQRYLDDACFIYLLGRSLRITRSYLHGPRELKLHQ
jgi:hypothetical protein